MYISYNSIVDPARKSSTSWQHDFEVSEYRKRFPQKCTERERERDVLRRDTKMNWVLHNMRRDFISEFNDLNRMREMIVHRICEHYS